MKRFKFLALPLMMLSLMKVDYVYSGEPQWLLWGSPKEITYDSIRHEWINNNPANENVFRAMDAYEGKRKYTLPERVPEKKKIEVSLRRDFYQKPEYLQAGAVFTTLLTRPNLKKRFVLINPEAEIWEPQYRAWTHLGLMYVGTAAEQEGWEVVIWDEHNQGHADLGNLVQPGDVVGFSMVVTGIKRGAELARQAKELGVAYVIAGNDSASFRARQLLELPGQPIDAVFTGNSVTAVREFFRQIEHRNFLEIVIPGVATDVRHLLPYSNQPVQLKREFDLRKQASRSGDFDPMDVFIVPNLNLYPAHVWEETRERYMLMYGHKHHSPELVRNAPVLFAQGCTRTQGKEACLHCTIGGVADIRLPHEKFLAETVQVYNDFGVNTWYNTTDSAFEMRSVAQGLKNVGARFGTLIIYGRAWGMAHHPELFERWAEFVDERIMVNCGMESADDRILLGAMHKAATSGSRAEENRQAILNLKAAGEPLHLHYSLIFGSPGETVETCERNLEFVQWTSDVLGTQLDIAESDIFWVNPGSPASQVVDDYEFARMLALQTTGRNLSREEWYRDFGAYADELMYPLAVEDSWFRWFTRIERQQAEAYNDQVRQIMDRHPGHIARRSGAFRAAEDREA
jgi:radical SAM superfamily enzyme YgiQ (UPF0313 family)